MNNILPFTTKTLMADVIHIDYRLIPILGRFGIDYGFGNKSVIEVCEENNINVYFFLEIIKSFHNHQYFPQEELQKFNADVIIKYLSSTHQYYSERKVPEIKEIINTLEKSVDPEHLSKISLLNNFFKDYIVELLKHLEREEKNVFPYILKLEKSISNKVYDVSLIHDIEGEPIENYEQSHENMEVKLSDLKNLIIRHLPPVIRQDLCQKLLTELFRLENDLKDHSRIEDKVLVPKVKQLEKQILEESGK